MVGERAMGNDEWSMMNWELRMRNVQWCMENKKAAVTNYCGPGYCINLINFINFINFQPQPFNFSGVIGKLVTRLPVALNTALAMAAAEPSNPTSPRPLLPMGFK